MRVIYEDLEKLRRDVTALVFKHKYEILWHHIKRSHPGISEMEILNALLYGKYACDMRTEGRYISWSRFAYSRRLLRVVFEVHRANEELVLVITAFEEE